MLIVLICQKYTRYSLFHPYLTLGSTCGENVWSVNAVSQCSVTPGIDVSTFVYSKKEKFSGKYHKRLYLKPKIKGNLIVKIGKKNLKWLEKL